MRRSAAGLAVVLAACAACSFGDPDTRGETSANALHVTRGDGSMVEFADRLQAWCGRGILPNDRDETLYVLGGERDRSQPYWIFNRETRELERSTTVEFPEQGQVASLFVFVPNEPQEYELWSLEEASSGEVVVEEWGCEKGDAVRMKVDARLQSDDHGVESLTPVEGEVVAEIGDPVPLDTD